MKTKYFYSAFILCLISITCNAAPQKKAEETNISATVKAFTKLNSNEIALWYYKKDTTLEIQKVYLQKDDTIIKGKYKNPDYTGYAWEEEFIVMRPFFTAAYTENDTNKAVVMFEGVYGYQHEHTFHKVDMLFFVQVNDTWQFLDTSQTEAWDLGNFEESTLCTNGLSIHSQSEWANMGAVSKREFFWIIKNEQIYTDLYFWTYSGHFRNEEPYDMEDEQSAEVVIEDDSTKQFKTIYYYGETYGCTKKDAEDILSYCSCKYVYENNKYVVYPLSMKEKRKDE